MRALIDTQALIWAMQTDRRVTPEAWAMLRAGDAELWFSAASVWEMAIKVALGKLHVVEPLAALVERDLPLMGVRLLPVFPRHALRVRHLPLHHRDPFDRMLVAQAQEEELALISADVSLDAYDIERVW